MDFIIGPLGIYLGTLNEEQLMSWGLEKSIILIKSMKCIKIPTKLVFLEVQLAMMF